MIYLLFFIQAHLCKRFKKEGEFLMNIQLLKYFIEIVNTRSLSAAARNLFVTQPTLSLALKNGI